MKKKLKIINFYDNIYKEKFSFIIGDSGQAKKYIKKQHNYNTDFREFVIGKTILISDYGIVVWLKRFNKGTESLGVLLHEVIHAVFFIFESKGIKFDGDYSEHFVYYCEYIMTTFLGKYKK